MKKITLRSGLMATTTICNAILPFLAGSALVATTAAVLVPSAALAQSAVGSVNGTTEAGATVTITDTETGVTNKTTADSRGAFSFTSLAPGIYTVTAANGTTETIEVRAGVGTTVSLASASTAEIIVRSSRTVNPIDVKSVESTSIFTAAQIDALPVGREVSSVALLAPGTVKNSHPNLGNAVSIGGSSPAENGYYINGFDVTNMRDFISYADLPFDTVGQVQIKTGGYGAEFGRSLGGVLSQVTKRGTNKWKFGGSVSVAPSSFAEKGRDVLSVDPAHDTPTSTSRYQVFQSHDESSSSQWTLYAGGPVIEDKLFVFGAYEGRANTSDDYGSTSSLESRNNSPMALLKVDYYLTPDHHFEYTGISNKSVTGYQPYTYTSGVFVGKHESADAPYKVNNGGTVEILKYTGHLTDNFTVSVMSGKLESLNGYQTPDVLDPAAALCVAAYDSRANTSDLIPVGCWNDDQFQIADIFSEPDTDRRDATRIDAEWTLGDHSIRFGYDTEEFTSSHRGLVYSGGEYYRYYNVYQAAGRTVNGQLLPFGTNYVRKRIFNSQSASFTAENTAFYIEDSWQITPNLMLYGGLRNETFTNKNGAGEVFAEADNQLAPRLGFSWDVKGDASVKVFGTYGRYYIPISTNTNIRMAGVEYLQEQFFYNTGFDPVTGAPTGLGAQIGSTNINGSLTPYPAQSLVTKNLEPMYQDEFILGAQKEFSDDLTLGIRSIYRKVGAGMDDACSVQPFIDWAADKGITDFDYHTVPSCYLINPGKNVILEFDYNSDGTFDIVDVDNSYFKFPQYKREYLSVELFGTMKGKNWNIDGSYTLSFSKGNIEGYVNSSLGQVDPGLTQDWDNYKFSEGSDGYLPNDRRHTLKLFGNYRLNEEVRFGGNLLVQSGAPLNCLGFVDTSDPALGEDAGTLAFYSASSFYCADTSNVTTLRERGSAGRTDWLVNFDFSAAYTPQWGNGHVTFQADVFNLFNLQTATSLNQTSQTGTSADSHYNLNYLQPTRFQTPRYARLTARFNF